MDKLLKAFFFLCGMAVAFYAVLLFVAGHWREHNVHDYRRNIFNNIHRNIPHIWSPRSVTALRDPVAVSDSQTTSRRETASRHQTGSGTDSGTTTGDGTDSGTTTGDGTDSGTATDSGTDSGTATGNGTGSGTTTGDGTDSEPITGNRTAKKTTSSRGSANGGEGAGQTPQRYLIYLCDVMWSCGGWADRQKGIVSVYLLSLATGRKFGVMMTKPCNVTQFYTPRDVNWIIPKSEVKGKSFVALRDIDNRERLFSRLKTMDFNKEYPQDVVYIRTNSAHYWFGLRFSKLYATLLPGWVRWNTLPVVFAKAWTSLMRPSQSIQHRLDDYLNSVGFPNRTHPFVCSHVRIGKSENIRNDFSVMTNVSDLPELWGFLDGYVKNGSLVFLATDNYRVRDMTRHRFGSNVSDTGGTIIHVERQARAKFSCPGFGVAILDQLILTHCDVLITSASGFSQVASYLRGSSKNLFTFQGGKIRKISI